MNFSKARGGQIRLESVTQELERLRSDLGELNLWIGIRKAECVSRSGRERSPRRILVNDSI
ncbi:hypothetical protein H5410_048500 [Solanum commersonii]|uniref:Uncharacterized protein n=1 Tax=Solanum commersonii TaxID=4109 RepID=A0A9J5XK06_SOLCO|nr:hypothetical protein H5410_048500 [Solanum commersonii]